MYRTECPYCGNLKHIKYAELSNYVEYYREYEEFEYECPNCDKMYIIQINYILVLMERKIDE